MSTEINAVINNLCEKFGVTVEYLLPKVSHYLFVMALVGTIVFSVLFTMCIASAVVTAVHYNNGTWDEEVCGWCFIVTLIAGLVLLFLLGTNIYNLVSVIASPEIASFEYIIRMVS